MRHFLALLALSYLGAALCVWWLSGFIPWFLLPDFPFLAIVFAGLTVLLRSPFGRTLLAIRENERRARSLGA